MIEALTFRIQVERVALTPATMLIQLREMSHICALISYALDENVVNPT